MAAIQPIAKGERKKPINLNLTTEIIAWLERESVRLQASKAVAARIHLEKAMRDSESKSGKAA